MCNACYHFAYDDKFTYVDMEDNIDALSSSHVSGTFHWVWPGVKAASGRENVMNEMDDITEVP